jgi:Tfp pilus assembly protein PilF
MVAEVTDRNSHAGEFFEALASALELSRKYPDAADALELAVQVMPRQVGPRGKLGLIEMRLGDETAARRTLEAAFAIDPFNVRVHNSLAVLDVLDNYATLETEHFRFRYDPAHDEILARCAARYLEEIYPELCRQLGAELSRPGLVEIFNRAENTDGQGWFSARIVGLPNVHLVAACTGRMVAVTSPAAIRQRVDWARVLRHELVHLINLDQTNFNVPHWFTEAVAVRLEDAPRRPEWHEMLVRRVARGELFDLDTINGAFVHPGSAENWQMAYCQADLYAEYLLETYGDDALRKMLAAYRTTRSTDRVLRDCFNVEQDDFERGYAEFLQRLVTEWQTEGVRSSRSFAELNRAYEQNPTDAGAAIDLAAAHVDRKQFAQARQLVDAVLADDPHHTGASAVKGRLLMAAGETAAARALLDGVLDRDAPHAEVLRLVSQLELRHGSREAAGRLLQLGAKRWPRDPAWTKSLTVVALENGDRQPLPGLLERIAESDPLDPKLRQKLALLAAADEDHTAAGRWAWEAIGLNVNDAAMHRLRARALLQSGDTDGAQFHNSIADQLDKPLNFFRQ